MSKFSGTQIMHNHVHEYGYSITDVIVSKLCNSVGAGGWINVDPLSVSMLTGLESDGVLDQIDIFKNFAQLTEMGARKSIRLESEIEAVIQFKKL